jgi:hypothetical protein
MVGQFRRPLAATDTALKAQSVGESVGAADDKYRRIRSPATRTGSDVFAVFHFADLQLEFPHSRLRRLAKFTLMTHSHRSNWPSHGSAWLAIGTLGGARLSPNQSPSACAKVSGDRLDRVCIPESSPPNRRPVCVNGSVSGDLGQPASLPTMNRARQILCVPAGRAMM